MPFYLTILSFLVMVKVVRCDRMNSPQALILSYLSAFSFLLDFIIRILVILVLIGLCKLLFKRNTTKD